MVGPFHAQIYYKITIQESDVSGAYQFIIHTRYHNKNLLLKFGPTLILFFRLLLCIIVIFKQGYPLSLTD